MPKVTTVEVEDFYHNKMPDLVPQVVNLNGSAKETILADYVGVLNALRALETAMGLAMPHGRDYQTHSDPRAYAKAHEAWCCRRVFLHEMREDIQYCSEMVANQGFKPLV